MYILTGAIRSFLDGIRNLVGLSQPKSYRSPAVPDHDQSAEAESTATLHNFGDAIEMDYLLNEFKIILLHEYPKRWPHSSSCC